MRATDIKMNAAKACFILAVAASVCPTTSFGQALDSAQARTTDLFARDRSVAVLERPHPEYEAIGATVGTFSLFPRLQLDNENSDNVFAVETGPVSDWAFHARPSATLNSNWSRHQLNAYVRGDFIRNEKYHTENANNWSIGGTGRVDVLREFNLALGADYIKAIEPRTASNTAVSARDPIKYDQAQAYLSTSRIVGRTKLTVRADVQSYNYKDGFDLNGNVIDQDARDRINSSLQGRADYAVSPATAVFVAVTGNKRNYDTGTVATPTRDSNGYELLTGVNFELGAVVRGEVAVGYLSQSFDNAAYGDIHGFGSRTRLEWFPTELTTITATASRGIEDAGVVGAGGYLSTNLGLSIDHELLRNVILSASAKRVDDDYNGIDRNDDRTEFALGGNYLVNRNLGVTLRYYRTKQSSDGTSSGPNYTANRVTLSLTTQF
ncbi:outer membrane beta-barrel protein [Caulobacter sp. UNC279MFTsu5.1]|uniref:outer membrane beta-barrel protein n=1 Tax=Caulobacter sp. UNC279MFTsu5.1 TaxID=1502775 RepID=UPI0008EE1C04|nr:outer membrane beta-barrel protein [Caulobacter sp. UNC279MFTsu5.1]SFJ40514.1 hypothetical protein SAMN02799626_01696 [Caulobacter sp. UNC279MFTsu5.1]